MWAIDLFPHLNLPLLFKAKGAPDIIRLGGGRGQMEKHVLISNYNIPQKLVYVKIYCIELVLIRIKAAPLALIRHKLLK